MFILPSWWEFSRYTLKDFRKVFELVCAISHIHWKAHKMAAKQGVIHKGYVDSLYMVTYGKLIRTVSRYSGMSPIDVQSVLDDLTYGNNGITSPVPALQPL